MLGIIVTQIILGFYLKYKIEDKSSDNSIISKIKPIHMVNFTLVLD